MDALRYSLKQYGAPVNTAENAIKQSAKEYGLTCIAAKYNVHKDNYSVVLSKNNYRINKVVSSKVVQDSELRSRFMADCVAHFRERVPDSRPLNYEKPNFKKYSEQWPLGPPGFFYNSRGKMCKISEMKQHYLQSTSEWLQKNFEGKPNTKFAFEKWAEIDKQMRK